MGPPPPPPPEGLCSSASWPWAGGIGVGEQSMPQLKLDRMEGLDGGGGGGLRFFLHFDPGKVDRTLLGVSLSAIFSRVLGQRRASMTATTDDAAAVSAAAALAAAVSVCLVAMHAASHRSRLLPRRRRQSRSGVSRHRALPAPHDGLRILSSKAKSSENVIHGASIGAGDDDDEPVIVARVETTAQADATPPGANAANGETTEQEERREHERRLRDLWLSLAEREQRLELRLQELEGLRELESRAATAAAEARVLELRTAALQEENGTLRAQLEDLDDARASLARAKEKLRTIKARVQDEREEARREEGALRARVAELEEKRGGEEEEERERRAALEAEAAALRAANAALEEENMELALRLQDAQQAASSTHLALKADMVEEAQHLREANERLTQQIEEMRSDHCAHVEELVYLKWVNACLRHELSDDQHGHLLGDGGGSGGVSAMELSKSMSYRSSERAKQLMLRYGYPGLDDPAALFSPLHESVDGGGGDDALSYEAAARSPAAYSAAAAAAVAAPGKTKPGVPRHKNKFLGNIKRLLPGGKKSRSSHGHGSGRESGRQAPPAPRDEYLEKAMQWLSTHDVLDFDRHSYGESTPLTPSSSCDRTPPSSVTSATTTRGTVAAAQEEGAALPRSKSDAGPSYGREAGRYYHSLRPDHPADERRVVAPPERREPRRRSEEVLSLRSPGAARA